MRPGLNDAHQFAARLGIELGKEDLNLSIALGGVHQGVSPMKMARGLYGVCESWQIEDSPSDTRDYRFTRTDNICS